MVAKYILYCNWYESKRNGTGMFRVVDGLTEFHRKGIPTGYDPIKDERALSGLSWREVKQWSDRPPRKGYGVL